MKKEKVKFSLKDHLFNEEKVKYLAGLFWKTNKKFQKKKFVEDVLEKFPELELKERITHITKLLKIHIDKISDEKYSSNIKIILNSLPPELSEEKKDDDFGDFIFAPLNEYVSLYGLEKKNLKISLEAFKEITKRFTSEGDIRFFINKYPVESFNFMKKMSISKNYHQRRLSSEGLRQRLPWCIGIDFDYKKSLEILDNLYGDKARYVVRSVANHLNDISKINPDLVVDILDKWKKEGLQEKKEFEYLVNHSLRTSIKKGHKKTMEFLGFNLNPEIKIINFFLENNKINIGDYLKFNFSIESEKNESLLIDYKIIYPLGKNGKNSEKVFKLKKLDLKKSGVVNISKKHMFKLMTTKRLYSGVYKIQLQINGKIFEEMEFELEI